MSRGKKTIFFLVIIVTLVFVGAFAIGVVGKGSGEKFGVVEIEGVITQSGDTMADMVRFSEDASIKGVIVRINSPGGSVGPTQEIYREMIKLREKKKVFVSMGGICASGGYYIASAGEKIYASPSTITGSIGVIMEQMVIEDLLKKIGVQPNTLKAGEYKNVGSPFKKMTSKEREYLDRIMTSIHEQFISDVAVGRKMDVESVRKLSDGRIYTGTQAKEAKLVDNIGTLYDCRDDLKTTLNIKRKPVLIYGKRPFSFAKWFFSSFAREMISQSTASPFKFLFKGNAGF
ncbi:MAG: signal peptide peptidase SppA [Syntrophobacterales bacterium]|jgi:protease-4|nr:signal peptide peptidase SppA [Syntrophobacterales bacterium]